jgi:acyl transferase domain-containing protein
MDQVAVVGLALRFPGARNVDEFWHNLVAGTESVVRVGDEPLDATGPAHVPFAGRLDDVEEFDAGYSCSRSPWRPWKIQVATQVAQRKR